MPLGDRVLIENKKLRLYSFLASVYGIPNINVKARWNGMKPLIKNFSSPILDAGCSIGYVTFEVSKARPRHSIVGIDADNDSIAMANKLIKPSERENIKFLVADAMKIPFPENTFGTVYCLDVVEHIVEDKTIFQELSRVLKAGGTLVLSTTLEPLGKVTSKEFYGHVRDGYTTGDLVKKIQDCNLDVSEIKYVLNIWGSRLASFHRFVLGANIITRTISTFLYPLFAVLARILNHFPGDKTNILIVAKKRK